MALVVVVVRKRDISRALEIGAAVAFVLVLLGADVPTVIAFVYGIVMYPYAVACKPVDCGGVLRALKGAGVFGVVVEGEVAHFN